MSLKLHVVFHGAESAFMRMPNCPCVRCREPEPPPNPTQRDFAHLLAWLRQAHTSASLVIEQDGVVVDHTLVDVGMGVVNNLVALPTPARGQPLTRLLLTHGHMDHVGGLDGLLYSLELARRSGDLAPDAQLWPLPVYATRLNWQRSVGLNPEDPTHPGHFYHNLHQMSHVDITAAARDLTAMELHPALTVTPIPVEHLYDSVNYLFTFWPGGRQGEGDPVRVAFCWDHNTVPAGRGDDVWQGVALDPRQSPLSELMRDLDLLATEMNTWHIYGHISFLGGANPDTGAVAPYGVRDLIQWWQPRVTRIVHYSGWDDRRLPAGMSGANGSWLAGDAVRDNTDPMRGPVSNGDLLRALHRELGESVAIDLAYAGEVLTFS